jgi:hypothetical protein
LPLRAAKAAFLYDFFVVIYYIGDSAGLFRIQSEADATAKYLLRDLASRFLKRDHEKRFLLRKLEKPSYHTEGYL